MASLDMAPWAAPELTGLHRVPMHSVPHEDRVLLDGEWRFQLLPAADAAATDAWGTITVPGSWAMQDKGDLPQYTNIVMPFPDLPPAVPAANPTGCTSGASRSRNAGRAAGSCSTSGRPRAWPSCA